mgnify:FL=1
MNDHSIPQHRQLYELLRRHIREGVYREGDLLPSENELCRIHNLTRPTVRQALSRLAAEGFIVRQQGKGSIVRSFPKDIGILSVAGTTSALGANNLRTEILVKPTVRPWDEEFMFPLSSLEKESGCIYMERLRLYNGRPIFYDINYIPNVNLPRFTSLQFKDRSLFEILRTRYQIEIIGGQQRIRARPAGKKAASFLQIRTGAPVLHLERKFETSRPNFYVYSSIFCNTSEHAIFGTF